MRKERGITLIALIITIIVMLILVAVSISILINSGLIGKAKYAGEEMQSAYERDSRMGDSLNINGEAYSSIDEYLAAINGEDVDLAKLQEFFEKGYDVIFDSNTGVFNDNVEPIPDASTSIKQLGGHLLDETVYEGILGYNHKIYGCVMIYNEITGKYDQFDEVIRKEYSNQFNTIALQGEIDYEFNSGEYLYIYEDNGYLLDYNTGEVHRYYIGVITEIGNNELGRAYLYNADGERISILETYNPRVWKNGTEEEPVLSTDGNNCNYIYVYSFGSGATCRIELTIDGETVEYEGTLSFPPV